MSRSNKSFFSIFRSDMDSRSLAQLLPVGLEIALLFLNEIKYTILR